LVAGELLFVPCGRDIDLRADATGIEYRLRCTG
jgi:hypothetical protein